MLSLIIAISWTSRPWTQIVFIRWLLQCFGFVFMMIINLVMMALMIQWWQPQVGPPLPMPKATTVCSRVMHYTYMNPVVSSYAFGWFFGSLLPVLPSAILSQAVSLPSSVISEITCRLIIAKFIVFEIRKAPFWNVLFPDMDIAWKGGAVCKGFPGWF